MPMLPPFSADLDLFLGSGLFGLEGDARPQRPIRIGDCHRYRRRNQLSMLQP